MEESDLRSALEKLKQRTDDEQIGVPSNDVFLRGGGFDLSEERDLLALSERMVLDHFARRAMVGVSWPELGTGCRIDPSARLLGPVIVHDGAEVGPDAVVKWSYQADNPGVLPGANLIFDALS